MNRLLLSILLILAATNAFAQSPVEVKTSDGRTVILKPDGTWEYKKDNPQPSTTPTANAAKPNSGTESFPPNFAGHDLKVLFNRLNDLKKGQVKGEFETTTDYEKRVQQEQQKPILDNLTLRDTFHLVIPDVEASYDADNQRMRFFLEVGLTKGMIESRYGRAPSRDKKSADNLDDVNLYEIKWSERDSNSYDSRWWGIYFDDMSNLTLSGGDRREGFVTPTGEIRKEGFSVEVSLGVEDAKRLKNTARAVAVVQLLEPYIGRGNYSERQLQVRLLDVYFFDSQTGRILGKAPQSTGDDSAIYVSDITLRATQRVAPVYSPKSKRPRGSGRVSVLITVDEFGEVTDARAVSDDPSLEGPAIDAARRWRFKPTIVNGKPRKVTGFIEFNFQL